MVYPDPYNTEPDPYWGSVDPLLPAPCPICGAAGGTPCVGSTPIALTYPPVDLAEPSPEGNSGPLRPYYVTVFGYTTVMQLDDADAAFYGDAATPIP